MSPIGEDLDVWLDRARQREDLSFECEWTCGACLRPERDCAIERSRDSMCRMFLTFFAELRQARVPVTPREYLDLMRALELDVADHSIEDFYRLARAMLVKDERQLDKFDVVFASVFKGMLSLSEAVEAVELPEEWLRKLAEKYL